MAHRPVFIPIDKPPFVKEEQIEFTWYPGVAIAQAQRCINSLHEAAKTRGIDPILEISSKSIHPDGFSLSAFNLKFTLEGQTMSVECAFQGSKVFERGGPYTDLYAVSSREAKKDLRLRGSGNLIGFKLLGRDFPVEPITAFYDWLYINALEQNEALAKKLLSYKGFTDIAFNPEKSYNCQARSAALYVALSRKGEIKKVIQDPEHYLNLIREHKNESQPGLFPGGII